MHKILKLGRDQLSTPIWRSLAIAIPIWACALLIFIRFGTQATDYHFIAKSLRYIPATALALSLGATALSFMPLVWRELGAFRAIGVRPPLRAILVACLCGGALDNAVGLKTLTGGGVRHRLYAAVGLQRAQIRQILSDITHETGLGFAALIGLAGIVDAVSLGSLTGLPSGLYAAVGILSLAAIAAIAIRIAHADKLRALILAGKNFLDTLRVICAASALWVLLPGLKLGFLTFTAIFATAGILGMASRLPGGIGVFEATMLFALSRQLPANTIASALVAFRAIYFIMPLVISSGTLGWYALKPAGSLSYRLHETAFARDAARLAPRFLGIMTFVAGVMLVMSGATPTFGGRLAILSLHLPLWVVEASHFLGSLVGVLILFVSRGLFNQRETAWCAALALALASLIFSLAKGLAYGEVIFLGALIALLLATRSQFRAGTGLPEQRSTMGWLVAVSVVIAASFSLLLFAFQDVDYTARDLWWQFEFDAQAPRALRAMVGVSVLALILATWELLRAPAGVVRRPAPEALAKAAEIIKRQDRSDALLALMGDKSLIFSTTGRAFVMYSKRGRSWIALYDPVGPQAEWPELIASFLKLADAHGGRAAFYQVRPANLPLYLEAGLSIIKLGEEARVNLAGFSLQGGARSNLRYALKRGEREHFTFELLSPEGTPAIMPDLETISDDWLALRRVGEKGFSVAAFYPTYVSSQSIALVREKGEAIAFATVMATEHGREAAVGLMRYRRNAPNYTMEFLFTRLILVLREAGYETLDLGMAPFSGLRPTPLTSFWHRLGALIWIHANPIYNFQGLRLFKGKFGPNWEPRYLAASGTLGPFVALTDAAALIGKKFKKVSEA